MSRKNTSVDEMTLLDLRKLALEKQQQGLNVRSHEEIDRAVRRYVNAERKKLAS
jgi:hypothetical protein